MLCVAFYLPNVCLRNHSDLQKICVTVVARCGMLYVTNSIMQVNLSLLVKRVTQTYDEEFIIFIFNGKKGKK